MMKQYSVLFLVAGGMTLSSTLAAYAMMDAPSNREISAEKQMHYEKVIQKKHTQTGSEVTSEKVAKPRLICNENTSNTGELNCGKWKNGTGSEYRVEQLQERKKLQQQKNEQMKVKWEMRDAIIDKLLAGESLSDTEKTEAKMMLAERKERKTEVKNRVEEVKASGEKVGPMKRAEIRKEARKDLKEERKIEEKSTTEVK